MWILPELQNHHLEFGIWPSMYTFVQFLYQNGISLYKEDVIQTNLTAHAAIDIFAQMTNLFTQSGLPLQYSFINRFRMGEMPWPLPTTRSLTPYRCSPRN